MPKSMAIGSSTGTVTRMMAVASIRQPRISSRMLTRIMKTHGLSDTRGQELRDVAARRGPG